MKNAYSALFLIMVLSLYSCASSQKTALSVKGKPKNIILMIGDGMGLAHVNASMTVSANPLNIQRCTVTGLQTNYSADNYITDSGASGTALATGSKTKNGAIGMDAVGNRLTSILELAETNGYATGLVSTSALTHATPASFIAHQSSRGSYEDIAMDFLKTDIDLFIGGGYNHFGNRKDKLNLIDSLKARGYEVATTIDQVMASNASKLAGFTAKEHNPYRLKGRGDMLPNATKKAVEILSKSKKGFFLMIEGSQIDWAAHANAADTVIDETLDFDKAAGIVLDFAAMDGNTLVIITADHETGGITLSGGNIQERRVKLSFSTTGHTGIMIPVFAFGPGAGRFTGIYDNTDIFMKMKAAMDF